jgi:hypothetical protein
LSKALDNLSKAWYDIQPMGNNKLKKISCNRLAKKRSAKREQGEKSTKCIWV